MQTITGINEANREGKANKLSKILSDEYVLYTKTKKAHWNKEGHDFYNKHKFFEAQFCELEIMINSIAERIRSLGHYVDAMLNAFLGVTQFTEQKRSEINGEGYIKELLVDHESLIMSLKGNIHVFANEYQDLVTSNFITGLMERHEKMAWFLRSHLK